MTKNEFLEMTKKGFNLFGFKQHKKIFTYEHEEFFIHFILLRSNYSDCYYLDINCSIKALHEDIMPEDKYFDFVGQPRITILDGPCQLKPEELNAEKYRVTLHNTIKTVLGNINKKGLSFIKELESNNDKIITCRGIFRERAREYLYGL